MKLTSLAEFVNLLWDHGLGAEMIKMDQEAAYRHVPVRKEDLQLFSRDQVNVRRNIVSWNI